LVFTDFGFPFKDALKISSFAPIKESSIAAISININEEWTDRQLFHGNDISSVSIGVPQIKVLAFRIHSQGFDGTRHPIKFLYFRDPPKGPTRYQSNLFLSLRQVFLHVELVERFIIQWMPKAIEKKKQ
jgi:hypothetical protein